MTLFSTTVGIDPSGRRLVLAAVRGGVGKPSMVVPPARFDLRSEREPGRSEEAGELLRDFVARHGLSGCEARLCVPADRVFSARIEFPVLRARDLGQALSMELERLFPFPASKLRFTWRRIAGGGGDRGGRFLVVASPAASVDPWAALAEGAGLRLAGAIPSGWAVSEACRAIAGGAGGEGTVALLRGLGGAVECTLTAGGEPFFSASRICAPEAALSEGVALVEEGMAEAPERGQPAGVVLRVPSGWGPALPGVVGGVPARLDERFEPLAVQAAGGGEEGSTAWDALGAFGAAVADGGVDLLSPQGEGPWPRIAALAAGLLAAAALALAVAWPATVHLKAKAELARLDARVAALRPAVERVGDAMASLAEAEEKIAVLRDASASAGRPLEVLRDLTGRLPQGTWLTGFRLEEAKVELDGFSPSANEIFPLLTRDGRYRKVEFASPITRQPDNLERFQIRAELTGAAEKGGGGKR